MSSSAFTMGVTDGIARVVLNLPGSPAGAADSLQAVIELMPHAIQLLAGKTEHLAN